VILVATSLPPRASAALSFLAVYAVRVNFSPTHVEPDIEIGKAIAPAGNSLVLFVVTVRFYFGRVVPRDSVRNAGHEPEAMCRHELKLLNAGFRINKLEDSCRV
jgi:hypothetical protein